MIPTAELLHTLRLNLTDDLTRFLPESLICAAIVLPLAQRALGFLLRLHAFAVAAPLLLIALITLALQWFDPATSLAAAPAFSGLLTLDPLGAFARGLLLLFALLAMILGTITGLPDREDSADYSTLLLGGTLGMMVMVSANHLLMVFLALEMASLPCYALAGFMKGRKPASEAALKYVLYGSAASGIALYGVSLLALRFGTGSLPEVTRGLVEVFQSGQTDALAAGGLAFLFLGLAFKLSAVPFHFWCPDVFEGAAAEVGAFLSVASKAAAVVLTLRIVLLLQSHQVAHEPLAEVLAAALMIVAALTATLGNLAALGQTQLKRMLAYSTIAHAGYMLMGLATMSQDGGAATLYYLAAYLPTNLGAFAVVALVRNRTGREDLEAYRGLMTQAPFLAIGLTVFLLSLLGLPPLAGFAGKFQIFSAVYHSGQGAVLPGAYWALLGVGLINTVISAGYYLKVLRVVAFEEPSGEWKPGSLAGNGLIGLLVVAVVALGVFWNPVLDRTTRAMDRPVTFNPAKP